MTTQELKAEHEHIYETRLGALGIEGPPPTWAHNMATIEADHHIAQLKNQERDSVGVK